MARARASSPLRAARHVHDQPARAEALAAERAQPVVGRAVHAQLVAEALGVERPALDERDVAGEAPEARERGVLALEGELQVVAGHGLVQEQVARRPRRCRRAGPSAGVQVEDARRASRRARRPGSSTAACAPGTPRSLGSRSPRAETGRRASAAPTRRSSGAAPYARHQLVDVAVAIGAPARRPAIDLARTRAISAVQALHLGLGRAS